MTALIAVYRDLETAAAVADELHRDDAVPDQSVRLADWADLHASLRAEMDAETAHGWGGIAVGGFLTSDMMRGAVIGAVVLGTLGIVVGLPIGYFLYSGAASTITKLGVGALVGFLFGTVVGTLLGGGMAMKSPEEKLAAERGYPVTVEDPDDDPTADPSPVIVEAVAVMVRHQPIRIDKLVDGQRVATPFTESPGGARETVAEFVANARDPFRR